MSDKQDNKLIARSFKVGQADWDRWQALAKAEGLPLSTWIKLLIRQEERRILRRDK